MPVKISWIIISIASACILFFCLRRDIFLEKQYPGDLRNRVVGARLLKDGHLPYFYKWRSGDGLRYYDPQNFDTLAVSNITVTPFFLQLLSPFTDYSQRTISKIWLGIEYIFLALAVVCSFLIAKNNVQRWGIILVTGCFLSSVGWKGHIAAGQYYIMVPALCMLFYYCITRNNLLTIFIAGLLTACIIFIRPNTFFFILPFLFLFSQYVWRKKLVMLLAIFIPLLFTVSSALMRSSWNDFRLAMNEQVKLHQADHPATAHNIADPGFTIWEGWDKRQVAAEAANHPYYFESEHGNLFVVVNRFFHTSLPVWLLTLLPLVVLGGFLMHLYRLDAGFKKYSAFTLAIIGYTCYMASDICSPFHRYQYNTVQWLLPLLLVAIHYNKRDVLLYSAIMIGLFFNIIELQGRGFEHSIGEYLIMLAMLILGYKYAVRDARN